MFLASWDKGERSIKFEGDRAAFLLSQPLPDPPDWELASHITSLGIPFEVLSVHSVYLLLSGGHVGLVRGGGQKLYADLAFVSPFPSTLLRSTLDFVSP